MDGGCNSGENAPAEHIGSRGALNSAHSLAPFLRPASTSPVVIAIAPTHGGIARLNCTCRHENISLNREQRTFENVFTFHGAFRRSTGGLKRTAEFFF